MIIENSEALKSWLTSSLGRMCDADPAALAKYVLALVKKDKPESELREFCMDQLEVFLLRNTEIFVNLLFETLRTNAYLDMHKPDSSYVSSSKACNIPNNSAVNTILNSIDSSKINQSHVRKKKENVQQIPTLFLSQDSHTSIEHTVNSESTKKDSKPLQPLETTSSQVPVLKYQQNLCHLRQGIEPENCDSSKRRKEEKELSSSDTDYRLETCRKVPFFALTKPYNVNIARKDSPKRCQDYDEKGYCIRGDSCPFDHGADPVVVEDVSVLNFNVPHTLGTVTSNKGSIVTSNLQTGGKNISKPLLPPLPSSPLPPLPPPPPPTLPPLPPAGSYIPQPYNPEAPGMDIITPSEDHSSFYVHHQNSGIHMQSHSSRSQSHSFLSEGSHNSKVPRNRELIGISTVDNISSASLLKENQSNSMGSKMSSAVISTKKRKSFDYSRLWGPKKFMSQTTLELKKVPKHLNTTPILKNYFSKFGTLTNIQVGVDNDPDFSALITFQHHSEAAAAMRSTDAVLNNRFIKMFYHTSTKDNKPFQVESKESVMTISQDVKADEKQHFPTLQKNLQEKVTERAVFDSARGNLCRTVFNPAVFKKTDLSAGRPKKEEQDALKKRIELHKKKRELLLSLIEHQKLLLAQLDACKSKGDKLYLRKTIKDIDAKITVCQAEIKKSSEDLKKNLSVHSNDHASTKSEAEKALLDAEMDLYKTQNKGDDTAVGLLLSKVNELKRKAKALGLMDNLEGMKAKRGHLSQFHKNSNAAGLLKIDNRPKALLISSFQDKEVTKKHFLHFGSVEKIIEDENKSSIIVSFSSRKAAEMAFISGKKLGENLCISWFQDQHNASEALDHNSDKTKDDNLHFVDEDEEDDDSGARSWRR